VGEAAIDSIIAAKKDGSFTSLADFCQRIDTRAVSKKVTESLIKAGAFDSFGAGRAWQLNSLDKVMSRIAAEQKERAKGQGSLFGGDEQRSLNKVEQDAPIDEFPPEQLLRMEKEMLGLYISSHPLEFLVDSLEGQTNTRLADIAEMREGEVVKIGGLLTDCRRLSTKKGDMMMVCNIEDLSGSIGLVIFPKTYRGCSELLNNDAIVVVKGKVNRDMRSEGFNIAAETIEPLAEMEKVRSLHIELVDINDPQLLARMKEMLLFCQGNDPVFVRIDGQAIALGKGFNVGINPELVTQLESLLGSGAVKVEFKAVKVN
jgi:DNA polymerase-3 subunit alpha